MAELLLGLDVGTTATKALAFDPAGRVVAAAGHGYGLSMPQPEWVEQEPEELWRAVVRAVRDVLAQLRAGDRIVALSQSSQGGATIPVDATGRPTYRAISWMDQRGAAEAEAVRAEMGAEEVRTTTGWPLGSGLPLQHIAWLRRHRPADFARTHAFLFVNDFIGLRLAGVRCMNPSDASITQLFNLAAGDWDDRLLSFAGAERRRLSPVRPSGHVVGRVSPQACRATGLPEDTLVVNGAHDQYCAAVGAGVTRPGKVLLSCGTAWVVLAVPATLDAGLRSGMAVSRHAVEGRWGAILSLGAVGRSMEWLVDNIWAGLDEGEDRAGLYDKVNAAAAAAEHGAGGLLFYPLAGGHAASYGPARGGFMGLTLAHARGDMARAVMEGTACELRWALSEIRAAGLDVSELTMVGGAARSPVWPQVVADVTDVPVVLPAMKQAAAQGAAILAGVGAGIFPDPEAGFQAFANASMRRAPDASRRPRYDEVFRAYRAAVSSPATANSYSLIRFHDTLTRRHTMLEGFDYRMARWLPFQDQAACQKARAIKREEITRHPNPDFKIQIVRDRDFTFRLMNDIFGRIKQSAEEGRRLVLILPQPEPLYAWVAYLCNEYRVSCNHLYTFNMDEYANEDGRIAPETWPNAFMYNMKHNFYARLDPELRPAEHQIQGPTDANFKDYGKLIADLGGADVCYGGIGWCGHLAYIEPGAEAFKAASLDEWKRIGPRIVELTPITILQGSLGNEFGKSGDWSIIPPKAATIGPAEVIAARLRSSWNGFMVGNSQVSWQRFIIRLAAHGPVTPLVPASILQTLKSELYITESGAADIVPESVLDFSWW